MKKQSDSFFNLTYFIRFFILPNLTNFTKIFNNLFLGPDRVCLSKKGLFGKIKELKKEVPR